MGNLIASESPNSGDRRTAVVSTRHRQSLGLVDISHFHESWTTQGDDLFGVGVRPVVERPSALSNRIVSGPLVDAAGLSSAIHDAARITNWDKVLELCAEHPEYARYIGRDGWTALHHACNRRCPHANVVEALIKAFPSALLKQVDKGWLPLHYACRFKAPKEVVRLLLHMYPDKGLKTVSKVDRLGRTPLYYAIRYDAPPGVVGLLLQVDPSAVLEEDQNEDSPLGLVWDSWAEKLEGKRIVNSFLPGGFPEPEDTTTEERAKILRARVHREPKLLKRWLKVNMLLKAAFGFPSDGEKTEGAEDEGEGERKWRIVHATAAVKCHLSLFLLACALHPEQVQELDENDLHGPGVRVGSSRQTALHLAAASNAGGEPGKTVLLTLLSQWREAAQIPDGIDESLPLHRMVENPRKQDWSNHAAILYRFYPRAVQMPDANGKLPLHRAAAAIKHVEQEVEESVIVQLVRVFPQAAFHTDRSGCLPMHMVAAHATTWDRGVEAIFNINRNAVQHRAGPDCHHQLPLHMAAASPAAGESLLLRLIQHHPRGVSMPDDQGKLPLHLACEVGKRWNHGVRALHSAFANAVHTPEDNARGWLPLHMAANAPMEGTGELIAKLVELFPEAATVADRDGRYPLHLACNSGKNWSDGIQSLFEADPTPMSITDQSGCLPFHLAALRLCHDVTEDEDEFEEVSPKAIEEKLAEEAGKVDILFNLLRADPTILAVSDSEIAYS